MISRAPPGNRLEALKGNRAGQHSIRVNDQFRICFLWTSEEPQEVELPTITQGSPTGLRRMICTMTKKNSPPMHPGEVLREEFLIQLCALGRRVGESLRCSSDAHGTAGERRDRDPADTALRLVKALGTSPELWLNLANRL